MEKEVNKYEALENAATHGIHEAILFYCRETGHEKMTMEEMGCILTLLQVRARNAFASMLAEAPHEASEED